MPWTNGGTGASVADARSPDSPYQQLCPCHVRRIFVAECLEHHTSSAPIRSAKKIPNATKYDGPTTQFGSMSAWPMKYRNNAAYHWMTDIAIIPCVTSRWFSRSSRVTDQYVPGPSVTGGTTRGRLRGTRLRRRTAKDEAGIREREERGHTQITGTRSPSIESQQDDLTRTFATPRDLLCDSGAREVLESRPSRHWRRESPPGDPRVMIDQVIA